MKISTREKTIINSINLEKLPFEVRTENIFDFTKDLSINLKKIFSLSDQKESLKWCFSSQKKIKIFLIIFEANENQKSIYKEEISKNLPEYSYKTIASIVDEGLKKGFFVNLKSLDIKKIQDKKIHNIRPSSELVSDFINWNIDALCSFNNYCDSKKKP